MSAARLASPWARRKYSGKSTNSGCSRRLPRERSTSSDVRATTFCSGFLSSWASPDVKRPIATSFSCRSTWTFET